VRFDKKKFSFLFPTKKKMFPNNSNIEGAAHIAQEFAKIIPKRPKYFLPLAAATLVGSFLLYRSFKIVPAGHVGIVDTFGKVNNQFLNSGFHFVNPFAKVSKISIKTRKISSNISVPSQEGMLIELESSLLYKLDAEKVVEIYKTVGLNYEDVILSPQLDSTIRHVTSKYDAKALYTSTGREMMTNEVKQELQTAIQNRGIIVEDIPLKNIKLPKKLTEAIEFKLSAEQESQKMKFVLEKETLEAERKRIEATGISDFQKIVSEGISEQLLIWKGIEATEKLAESNNSKVVVIGGGKSGLPLILNTEK
jgi:prohibitin 1